MSLNKTINIKHKAAFCLVLGDTGSVWGGIGLYFVVGGQYRAVQDGTWCNCISIGQHWMALGGTGSVRGFTGRYLVVLGQNIGSTVWLLVIGAFLKHIQY